MSKFKKITFLLIATIIFIFLIALLIYSQRSIIFKPTKTNLEPGLNQDSVIEKQKEIMKTQEEPIQTVVQDLKIPWEFVFLTDDSILITERTGNLLRWNKGEKINISISDVEHAGEGGLMGLALHPDYSTNNFIYLYLTTKEKGKLSNRVERYIFNANTNDLSDKTTIIENIPGANYHDGGRIAFGPDGYLYITTGDSGQTNLAQDTNSLAGKILRLNADGSIPGDNPFQNEIYSYGHRNPQGLAWDSENRLWATEHGPSGIGSGYDEVNLIEKGKNYGWPTIQGNQSQSGLQSPIIQSGGNETWAPAGIEIIGNKLFFVGLRGESLYSAEIADNSLTNLKRNFSQEFGRLRAIQEHDGWLYIATSNQDGRGTINKGDDKLMKIHLSLFE